MLSRAAYGASATGWFNVELLHTGTGAEIWAEAFEQPWADPGTLSHAAVQRIATDLSGLASGDPFGWRGAIVGLRGQRGWDRGWTARPAAPPP